MLHNPWYIILEDHYGAIKVIKTKPEDTGRLLQNSAKQRSKAKYKSSILTQPVMVLV